MDHVRSTALPSRRQPMFRSTTARVFLVGTLTLTLAGLAVAQRGQPGADKGDGGGKNVYQRVLKSTVWVVLIDDLGNGRARIASGSGALIDVRERLVLTNYHVVRTAPTAKVMFPIFNKNELVAEKEHYQNLVLRGGGGLTGKVIAKEARADLALIQLDRLPPGAAALALAANGVGPGEDVHSIGNPAASGALWAYTRGSVKAVYRKSFRTSGPNGEGAFEIDARVVETSSPVNAGDSGGPVVNGNGELVAITQGHLSDETARSISYFIDLSEIKTFLKAKGHGRVLTQPAVVSTAATDTKVEDKASIKDPA